MKNNTCVNNLRTLGCDTIMNVKGGHSGIVLSAAPIMWSLYSHALNVNPKKPDEIFRDRFVLSAGHGSALLYAALHMFGYDIKINDLKKFRQLGSLTPGHPEIKTPGVDCATGPLGAGVATAVGMAIAERFMGATFNKKDIELFDNYTYALVGDGCLMEGVANEALSLAGTLKLNKLIVLYDENKASLDSNTNLTFAQDTRKVFEGYGFNVVDVDNGNNVDDINKAIDFAKKSDKPSLIIVHTEIGYASKNQGNSNAHAFMFSENDYNELKTQLGITVNKFEVLDCVQKEVSKSQKRYAFCQKLWDNNVKKYKKKYPVEYARLQRFMSQDFSKAEELVKSLRTDKDICVRDAGNQVLNILCTYYDNIVGGTADLGKSTKTIINNGGQFNSNPVGRNILYGVREFAMASITNGLALYGGIRPFASTFTVFGDYMKPAMRMSALMKLPVLYILSHDGLDAGGDGPTHQPIEQLDSFRAIPNTYVFRPTDLEETKASYIWGLNHHCPTIIVQSRNISKEQNNTTEDALRGGYVISKEQNNALDGVLLACGTEVTLAIDAQFELKKKGINVRVVSMPCERVFDQQKESYKNKILPKGVKVMALESASGMSWYKYIKYGGMVFSLNEFGTCGPFKELREYFKFTLSNVVSTAKSIFKK